MTDVRNYWETERWKKAQAEWDAFTKFAAVLPVDDLLLQAYCGFAFDAGLQIAELERKLAAVTCSHDWERVYGKGSDGTEYWTGTKKCTRCGALR